MRGRRDPQNVMFVVADLESVVPDDHPLRKIKARVDEEMRRLSPLFNEVYSHEGRPSVPPERLIKATLLQALYSIRSERELVEQIGQSALSLVFGHAPGRAGVESLDVFEKSRAADGARPHAAFLRGLGGPGHFRRGHQH